MIAANQSPPLAAPRGALDKLMQLSAQNNAATPSDAASPNVAGTAPPQSSVIPVAPADSRARDGRSRDRDVR